MMIDLLPSIQPFSPTSTVTTLPNRIRVATEPLPGHFHAVGVYVDAGSRFESQRTSGVSHLLDRMAFKVGSQVMQSDHTHYTNNMS